MRYATFSTDDDPTPRLGVVHGGRIGDVQRMLAGAGPAPATLSELIQSGPDAWRRLGDRLHDRIGDHSSAGHRRTEDVRWHAPIPRPAKNIVCLGLNYVSHVRETTH